MANFFQDLGKIKSEKAEVVAKKTGEVADVVVKKTEQTVEVQKIKSQISVMQRNNDRDYRDIGKMIYDNSKMARAQMQSILNFVMLLRREKLLSPKQKKRWRR